MIDDKTYAALLQAIRDGNVGVLEVSDTRRLRLDGRKQTIDFRPALTRLVAERDDAIAQTNDADNATDNATQIAERVVRELRQEYVDVIDRLEKQSAAREEALRAENERLREALADIREWAKRDDFIRFDDGDIPLADYCARALHGGK
jgi:hypothetical protein